MPSNPFQWFCQTLITIKSRLISTWFPHYLPLDECVDNIKAHEMVWGSKVQNLIKELKDKQNSYPSEQMPHKSQYQSHLVGDTSQNAKSTWKSLGPQRYGQQLNTTETRTHNRQNSKREHRTHKLPLSICNTLPLNTSTPWKHVTKKCMHKSKEKNAPPQMQNSPNATCHEKLPFDDNATIKIHMRAQKACHEVYNLLSFSNIWQSTYKG